MTVHHRILGVAEGASTAEIKTHYRALCKEYHPDLNDGETIGRMALINEAYAALVKGDMPGGAEGRVAEGVAAGRDALSPCKDQSYAFYKKGIELFREADPGMTFRDSNEWNKSKRVFDNPENVNLFERYLIQALHCFNVVCSRYGSSPWMADAMDKIREINRKREMIRIWRERFDPR